MRLELTTSCLEGRSSTVELRPRGPCFSTCGPDGFKCWPRFPGGFLAPPPPFFRVSYSESANG